MRLFRIPALLLIALVFALPYANPQTSGAVTPSLQARPVNPNATAEARALLQEIDEISGRTTLTGQHNFPNHVSRWSDRVYDLTGKFPAVFGQDFGFSGGEDKDSVLGRPSMIEEVQRQYLNGAVIALTWHAVRPTDDEPVTFRDSVQGHLTDFEWDELLTPGTNIYNRWVEQVDVIAGYLRQLQEAGVPVLFRPYHEMNGNWFWWGGRPGEHGSAALYRQLYDRYVNVHHLNNLVWVWNINSPSENAGSIASYFPGAQYADIVTMDVYGEFKQGYYDDMLTLARNKPIALAEVGAMPSLEVLAHQPRWAYFMMWSGMAEGSNSPDQLQTVFHAQNVLNRGDSPFKPSTEPPHKEITPVTPHASHEAVALLHRLHAVAGTHILSGQQNDPATTAAASQQVFQVASKFPAIYGTELESEPSNANSARSIVDEAIRQSEEKSIVSLRWLPPNPAESDPVQNLPAGHDTRNRPLTDYEWQELLTPGSHLYLRWCAQADATAEALKQLDSKGIAVMFTPYPDPNSKTYWWSGRQGIHGSAALYRMLFDRLVNHNNLHNLVWIWEGALPGFGTHANGAWSDYFPGLLYADAIALHLNRIESRFRSDQFLKSFAAGKVIGLYIDGSVPERAFFAKETDWAWFVLVPQAASVTKDASDQALRLLYGDPRIVTR